MCSLLRIEALSATCCVSLGCFQSVAPGLTFLLDWADRVGLNTCGKGRLCSNTRVESNPGAQRQTGSSLPPTRPRVRFSQGKSTTRFRFGGWNPEPCIFFIGDPKGPVRLRAPFHPKERWRSAGSSPSSRPHLAHWVPFRQTTQHPREHPFPGSDPRT